MCHQLRYIKISHRQDDHLRLLPRFSRAHRPPSMNPPLHPPTTPTSLPSSKSLTTTTTKSKISSTCTWCLHRPAVSPALPMLVAASRRGAASSRLSSPVSRICTGASPLTAACNADNICRRSKEHLFKTQLDKTNKPSLRQKQYCINMIYKRQRLKCCGNCNMPLIWIFLLAKWINVQIPKWRLTRKD